jgi:nitrogen fixation protein FixH
MTNKTKIKFNWGWGILSFFTLFVGFMIFMVYKTTTINPDLVTTDYYKQEIEYQDKIDMKNNLAKTGKHVSVSENGKEILVSVPMMDKSNIEKAEVYFYRPSDESKDLKLDQHTEGIFVVPNDQLAKGEYVIKTKWSVDGVNYYEEINFNNQ